MAVAIKLDEATLAKVKEYAAETFEGFDADNTAIFGINSRTIEVPYLKPPASFAARPWPRYREYTLSVPANWFERFKDDYWPRWLRRLWPVRTKRVTYSEPVYGPIFANLSVTTEPHTLKDGEIIELGYGACEDGQIAALAVKVAE